MFKRLSIVSTFRCQVESDSPAALLSSGAALQQRLQRRRRVWQGRGGAHCIGREERKRPRLLSWRTWRAICQALGGGGDGAYAVLVRVLPLQGGVQAPRVRGGGGAPWQGGIGNTHSTDVVFQRTGSTATDVSAAINRHWVINTRRRRSLRLRGCTLHIDALGRVAYNVRGCTVRGLWRRRVPIVE